MTAHTDTFAHDRWPPRAQWPELIYDRPALQFPDRLNCATELLDAHVAQGRGERLCLVGAHSRWTYAQMQRQVDRIAHVLVQELGVVPGNRVLLRGPNAPMLAACWFAVMKVGAIAVTTMPLLRTKELAALVEKAQISHALCDARLLDELQAVDSPHLRCTLSYGSDAPDALDARAARHDAPFTAVDTEADDCCLIAFTSGTTGQPKGCMHSHRDVMAICRCFPQDVLRAQADDVVIGSPPLAFTFGLGGLLLFPMSVGAAAVLLEKATPDALPAAIAQYGVTTCYTSPTAYRAMAAQMAAQMAANKASHGLGRLRQCVSAGEALPAATRQLWKDATGIELIDGIGATELLHIFISHREEEARPGATGKPIPGYRAKVVDDAGRERPRGQVGRLAVQGPTGCRYLDDPRQTQYVKDGWNLTGDAYLVDQDGYFVYQARTDDMIVSGGYNIAGPEVEDALMQHPAVAECGVVGEPDAERGQIVKAYVVLKPGHTGNAAMAQTLQDFVKATVAPYKYPRAVVFCTALPRTETGKLQRFKLKDAA